METQQCPLPFSKNAQSPSHVVHCLHRLFDRRFRVAPFGKQVIFMDGKWRLVKVQEKGSNEVGIVPKKKTDGT